MGKSKLEQDKVLEGRGWELGGQRTPYCEGENFVKN